MSSELFARDRTCWSVLGCCGGLPGGLCGACLQHPTGVELATREWLGDNSGYEVLDVSLLTDAVEVRLAGTGTFRM